MLPAVECSLVNFGRIGELIASVVDDVKANAFASLRPWHSPTPHDPEYQH